MFFPLFVALLIITILSNFLLPKAKRNRKNNLPPGPIGFPFIGNLHQYDSLTPHLYYWKLSKKSGKIFSLKLGSSTMIVISSLNLAKEVTKIQDLAFCSRPSILGQQKLSYNGQDIAISPYNEYWRELRKICVLHLFSLKKVQHFSPILAFGIRYDEETRERRKFDELLKVTEEMMASFFVSDYFPLLGWIDKLSGKIRTLEKNFKALDEFYEELIEQHLNPDRPKSMEGDIVDLLFQLKKEKSTPINLSLDNIKAIIMNMLLGGADTSAATVIWAMTALIRNPNAMKKVQAEIRESVGKKSIVNEDDIQNLPYFKAVIKETFRLYPPAPLLLVRETMQSSILEGYEIKPKTIIHVNVWAIARDPEIWENPEEFIPERFLNSDIDFRGQNFELLPFGAGRRGCSAIALGVATVELLLSNLLYAFDWELPSGMRREDIDTDVFPGLTMHKKNALCLFPRDYY
ncbi:hypothetical protein P3S67_002382 [Capsicum chacoense]